MVTEPTAALSDSTTPALPPKVASALTRFRIFAFTEGVALLILVALMVLKYGFGGPDGRFDWTMAIWGPTHGVIFAVYVLFTFDLAYKDRWTLWGIVKVVVAGIIPVVSFYGEAWATRKVRARQRI